MKVLGVVNWTDMDKRGTAFARVRPLYEVTKKEWRSIDAREEFPTEGQAFWPAAREATTNSLVFFRAEYNADQKDEYRVVDAQPAIEIIDLRGLGDAEQVRRAFADGLRKARFPTTRALIWCTPNVLLGPIKLARNGSGVLTYDAPHRDRIPTFAADALDIRTIRVGDSERAILASTTTGASSGYADWDDDRTVLRRALTAAVEHAKRSGANPGLTKKMIDEAAEALAAAGTTADARLDSYRLERARALCAEAANVARSASEVSEILLGHPAVTASMAELKEKTRQQLMESLRSELEAALTSTKAELSKVRSDLAREQAQCTTATEELRLLEQKALGARAAVDAAIASVDTEVAQRLRPILDNPASVLAEIAVLKPFLSKESSASPITAPAQPLEQSPLRWFRAESKIDDAAKLRRALLATFKARGVKSTRVVQMHAAIIADLVPVLIGSGALAAIAAYADAVCGSRACILHIGPAFMHPSDLAGALDPHGGFRPHSRGLLAAATAASEFASPSLFVCEGVNRAPTESYLVPFLQMRASKMAFSAPGVPAFCAPPGLRFAATSVAGATTLPASHDSWTHAVVIDTELVSSPSQASTVQGTSEICLTDELALPGDVPEDLIEELVHGFPWASEVRSCLERFAAAMSRFESDEASLKSALVECVLVPCLATSDDEAQREDGLRALQSHYKRGSEEPGALAALERRVRRRLG